MANSTVLPTHLHGRYLSVPTRSSGAPPPYRGGTRRWDECIWPRSSPFALRRQNG